MHIAEESSGILLDLRNMEACTGIFAITLNSGHERPLHTSDADALVLVTSLARVWESDAWWTSLALRSLMDVCWEKRVRSELPLIIWVNLLAVSAGESYFPRNP